MLRAGAGYALGLRPFLRRPLDPAGATDRIRGRLDERERAFAGLLELAVLRRPRSPYRLLLDAAGVEAGDVTALLAGEGLDGALGTLARAGVRLSLDEFKGRQPIRRGSFELWPQERDFDNPLLRRHYAAETSGSSATPRRVAIDLGLLDLEADHLALSIGEQRSGQGPAILWRAVPPGLAGLKMLLRRARLGLRTEAWLSPTRPPASPGGLVHRALLAGTLAIGATAGRPLPRPRIVPLDQPGEPARLLADAVAAGSPGELYCTWSSAVRVCESALGSGLDLAGSRFRLGGEPATRARVATLSRAGVGYLAAYSMGEVGRVGEACFAREGLDDVHLLADKLALLPADDSRPRGPVVLTTVSPCCPKLLINVDTGDRARRAERDCGCALGSAGLRTVLSEIDSEEKLTVEGMNFTAAQIGQLLEEAIPARLGGSGSDYQLVIEAGGRDGIGLVVGPGAAALSDERIAELALAEIAAVGEPQRMMAEHWRQAGSLRVLRRAPFSTASGKVPQLHLLRRDSGQP